MVNVEVFGGIIEARGKDPKLEDLVDGGVVSWWVFIRLWAGGGLHDAGDGHLWCSHIVGFGILLICSLIVAGEFAVVLGKVCFDLLALWFSIFSTSGSA